ncbi:hypothetical protein [Amycolatopsis eburnea]|uniref:Uncharacterized protein n=1 Tax=Amycolatopsis eburnea TaxID=2267691 RepID=A0A3R9EIR0_9PSEU|nr:hypothetical protein [Amycolatopsis eburnea]RSD08463.1 hypothetical protein EIY87_42620 [Amycolatopsis eburnea]
MAGAVTGEHERYARYLLEFANVTDADEPDLVRAVLTDPDRVMAESAVVQHVDLRAVTTGEDGRETDRPQRRRAARRARERV